MPRKITEIGARPGLWMAMTMIGVKAPWLEDSRNREAVWGGQVLEDCRSFALTKAAFIDPSNPRAKDYIADRIRHAVG